MVQGVPTMDERATDTEKVHAIIDSMYPTSLLRHNLIRVFSGIKSKRELPSKEIAELILHIAETSHREWPIKIILDSLNEVFDSINWREVYESLPECNLNIWSTSYLYTLVDCWMHISGVITVPYEIFLKPWANRDAQLNFLRILLDSDDRRTQIYANIFFEKLVSKDEVRQTRYKRAIEYESNMNSVELFKCVRDLDATEIVEFMRSKSPDYTLLGLFAVRPFCESIFEDLLTAFCEATASNFIYQVLFSRNKREMLCIFDRIRERVSLSRVLDIFVEHKMLSVVIELGEPQDLAFDIIILATRREHLNLEIWLNNNLRGSLNSFIDHLYKSVCRDHAMVPENEMFPYTRSIVITVLRVLESKGLEPESNGKIKEIKALLGDSKSSERVLSSDRAIEFISEIINSHSKVEDAIFQVKELLCGDDASVAFAKRIFGLLVDNYSNLYKLPNSDLIAVFFGELIKQQVFIKPYSKMSLQLIKNSLVNPSCDREFSFAFRILEVFLSAVPEFFSEIEGVEAVRTGLVKKELILVDEDAQRSISLSSFLEQFLEDVNFPEDKIAAYVASSSYDVCNVPNECVRNALTARLAAVSMRIQRGHGKGKDDSDGDLSVPYPALASHIFHNSNQEPALWAAFTLGQPDSFQEFLIEIGFEMVKGCFQYRFDDEVSFYENLGVLLGLLTVAQDRTVCLDLFDFKTFILKSIEYRRITLSVIFVTSFFKQGTSGITCVPRNPWLMSILDLLSELYPCTLMPIRNQITSLFKHFKVKMEKRQAFRMKEHLIKYVLAKEGILKQVISAALDFSVREVCNKIVKASVSVANSTATEVFFRILRRRSGVSRDDNMYFFYRNCLINLTRSLIHISAQEPLKASICGNITHFLKLSGQELPLEEIYKIATENLEVCSSLIEKVGITQVCEQAVHFYNVLQKRHAVCGRGLPESDSQQLEKYNLGIINESVFVEKTHVRSIENAEYQEIRSFLIQLSRKVVPSKRDVIVENWHLLLESSGEEHFEKMAEALEVSPERDAQCLSLCKYLVGHALRTECVDEKVFLYITKILAISPKTNHEVLGWLIYSNDQKRYNIKLIKKFIFYNLIRLEEYDQAMTRLLALEDKSNLSFVLDLLTELILGEDRLCSVYDFIHTIETLNKMNDDARVFEFFKEIETGMMQFGQRNDCLFDEFVMDVRLDVSAEQVSKKFKEFCKSALVKGGRGEGASRFNFLDAMRSSWHHFVLQSNAYRFYKIDILAYIAVDDLYNHLKESLQLLIQANAKQNYLFFSFYSRFFRSILDALDNTLENRALIFKVLEILAPSVIPGFTVQFLHIMDHEFIAKGFGNTESFLLFQNIIQSLHHSRVCELYVLRFFSKYFDRIRRFSPYLSYLCPETCPSLKNLFSKCKDDVITDRPTNPYFAAHYLFSKQQRSVTVNYAVLIDNLSDLSGPSLLAQHCLKNMLERSQNVDEIALLLLLRMRAASPPYGLVTAYNEFSNRKNVKEILTKYIERFYNKI